MARSGTSARDNRGANSAATARRGTALSPPPPPRAAAGQVIASRFQAPGLFAGLAGAGRLRFQLYLYDGPHSERDHFDALALVAPHALEDTDVLVVDDWCVRVVWRRRFSRCRPFAEGRVMRESSQRISAVCLAPRRRRLRREWDQVQYGTRRGLAALGHKVLFEAEGLGSAWHNGYWAAVVRKP